MAFTCITSTTINEKQAQTHFSFSSLIINSEKWLARMNINIILKLPNSQFVSRCVCTSKDSRLQRARMWSEWKELQARETLTSHAVLLPAHAAHPQHYTAGLSSCTRSRAVHGEALRKSSSAVHQWLPSGLTNSLPAVRDARNKPCAGFLSKTDGYLKALAGFSSCPQS